MTDQPETYTSDEGVAVLQQIVAHCQAFEDPEQGYAEFRRLITELLEQQPADGVFGVHLPEMWLPLHVLLEPKLGAGLLRRVDMMHTGTITDE